ncbi:Nucleolar GTP-binding protein 1 [Chlorella vulgaris]
MPLSLPRKLGAEAAADSGTGAFQRLPMVAPSKELLDSRLCLSVARTTPAGALAVSKWSSSSLLSAALSSPAEASSSSKSRRAGRTASLPGAHADTPPLASAAFAAATPGLEQDHLDIDVGMPLSLPRKLGAEAAADSGTGAFQRLPMVAPSKELLDSALRRAARVPYNQKLKNEAQKAKNRAARALDTLMKELCVPLGAYIKGFPQPERLHPFERALLELTVGPGTYERVLARVEALRRSTVEVGKAYATRASRAANKKEAVALQEEGFASLQAVFSLDELKDVAKSLRRLPVVEPNVPTVALVGAPNVGKSSLVQLLSSGLPEVQNYPFTTRSIKMGHFYVVGRRHQVTDTPGLLNRAEEDRNAMERLTLACLQHLPTAVLFVVDLTGECGTTVANQWHIREELRARFPGKPWVDAFSKADLLEEEFDEADVQRAGGQIARQQQQCTGAGGTGVGTSAARAEDGCPPARNEAGEQPAVDAVQFAVRVPGALRVSSTSGSGVDDLKAAMLRMLEQHDLQRQQPETMALHPPPHHTTCPDRDVIPEKGTKGRHRGGVPKCGRARAAGTGEGTRLGTHVSGAFELVFMTNPRRAAVLALCVLGLAAYATAQCNKIGTISVDLTDTNANSDPIAKCLSSMTIVVAGAGASDKCQVTITPNAAEGNFVNAIWGSNADLYTVLQACPTTSRAVHTSSGTDSNAAIAEAINKAIYGSAVTAASVTSATYTSGQLALARGASGPTWTYAVTAASGSDFATTSTDTVSIASSCSAGAYGVAIDDTTKICALCPAGSYSAANNYGGCTPCDAGTFQNSVGQNTCDIVGCARGTYAEAGTSDCLPCAAGTYAGTEGSGVCKSCPDGTYSNIPGSTACFYCAAGRPICDQNLGTDFSTGAADGDCTDGSGTAASEGSSILEVDSIGTLKTGLTSYVDDAYKPALFSQCTTVSKLALTVAIDCSVDILPITETSCAEPGSNAYSYNGLAIQGVYDGKTKIRTLLPSGAASSYLLTLTPTSGSGVSMSYFAATTDASVDMSTPQTVTGTFVVSGEGILGTSTGATCPPGSFKAGADCEACPVGYTCDGTTSQTACGVDSYNPYVGATACLACATCRTGGGCTDKTSVAGSDYCNIPYVDVTCTAGQNYDETSNACVACEAGTYSTDGVMECAECPAGQVPTAGKDDCDPCTGNTVAPVGGLVVCEACPMGSIANVGVQDIIDRTECVPCSAGLYSTGTACQACAAGTYRTGDATPANNVCKRIPAGYREKTGVAARSEIVPCEKGTYSFWVGSARTPSDPTTCKVAGESDRLYAPRVGMQQGLPCKAGTRPSNSGSASGADMCTPCAPGTYRDFSTNSATCALCDAGRESGPSGRAACTPCQPGFFNLNGDDFCSACPLNKAQPLPGQTDCNSCLAGEETFDDGNSVCSKCAKGFYNPSAIPNPSNPSCVAAPAGGYVNTTGAKTYTPCGVGTFSDETGSDWCDICPPGQYANTKGSKACKTCPAGTYSSGGASTCKSCAAGYYAPSGSSICSPCKAGSFSATTRATTCSPCPKGKQCPMLATKTPTSCKAGYFSSKEGQKTCTPCPVNKFRGTDDLAGTSCAACPRGTGTRGLPAAYSVRSAAAAATALGATTDPSSYDALVRWCIEQHQLPPLAIEPAVLDGEAGTKRSGFVAAKAVAQSDVVLEIPGSLAITSVDVSKDPQLEALARGRSELVGLALWLMLERSKASHRHEPNDMQGGGSEWHALLQTLPQATLSPILWSDEEREQLLRGSPVQEEARTRQQALRQEWTDVVALAHKSSSGSAAFPVDAFNEQAFLEAMSVVLMHAAYLPSAQCFAMLPLVGGFCRTGSSSGALLDYDLERGAVTVVAQRTPGQEVAIYDGRPNDCLFMEASLVAADRLYTTKRDILEELGLGTRIEFPIFEDRIATQQLVFLRLSRLQDPAQLAKARRIDFATDTIVSPENEYEILQLMMADLRDRLQAYASEYDDDVKDLQRRDLTPKQRLAAQLRLGEKRILSGTMGGVRRRLAPIRGIPTKSGGMQDPNADFAEIFETLESLPGAPKKLLDGIGRWLRRPSRHVCSAAASRWLECGCKSLAEVHRVSLKKLPYKLIQVPPQQQQQQQGAAPASAVQSIQSLEDAQADCEPNLPSAGCSELHSPSSAMEAFASSTAAAIEDFESALESDPAAFLQPTAELVTLAKAATKALYDHKAVLDAVSGGVGAISKQSSGISALPKLYVDGFDAEQIWLQLELATGPALKHARRLLKKATRVSQLMTSETEEAIDELLGDGLEGAALSTSSFEYSSDEDLLASSEGEYEKQAGQDRVAGGRTSLADLDYDALLAAGAQQRHTKQPATGTSDSEDEGKLLQQAAGVKRKRGDDMEAFVQQAERYEAGLEDERTAGMDATGDDVEDAELEALLEHVPLGRDKKKAKLSRRLQQATFGDELAGGDDDMDGQNIGADAMYEDFFGPRSGVHQGHTLVPAGGDRFQDEDVLSDEGGQSSEEDDEDFQDDLLSDDMLSGEDDEILEQQRQQVWALKTRQRSSREEEDGEEFEEGKDDAIGARLHDMTSDESDFDDQDDELAPSAHAQRQQRMQDKIRKLEDAAMGDKAWFMQGEVDAGRRPKNSALEIDLDFETTVKPPPQPTEEMTRSLDELIKARIVEGRFDDVLRLVAPPLETKRTTLELDDTKPQQGLGELYEQEYMQAVTGAADDKDEEVRQMARAQFSALCSKLDSLSHLHLTPRPVMEEVTVKLDVPAIIMEEAAPQFVSGASMQAPEEVFATEAAGAPRADGELGREDRKRNRAQRKRAGKKRELSALQDKGTTAGRKSEVADRQVAREMQKSSKKTAGGSSKKKSEFSRSAAVMAKLEDLKSGDNMVVIVVVYRCSGIAKMC